MGLLEVVTEERYIKSSSKDYQDHYVAILNCYEQDKDKLSKKGKTNHIRPGTMTK